MIFTHYFLINTIFIASIHPVLEKNLHKNTVISKIIVLLSNFHVFFIY